MKKESFNRFQEKHDRDGHHKRKDKGNPQRGAKTFRRGKALAFMERMNTKRNTLKQQLEAPEYQSIYPILIGELKAIDMVINEFSQLFEINEEELTDIQMKEKESPELDTKKEDIENESDQKE